MAIANHNYIGYCYDTLVKYKVRWIEAAVVCPVWTTLMCYYIEEDRGHVMQEELFRGKHRMAVRGNIFSFPMPWNEIMKSLLNATATPNLTVPHPPEMLAHMVRLHLNFGTSAQIPPLKEVCVRTHVILQLGYDLIESGHPALLKTSNAGPVLKVDVARIKAAYRRRVEEMYPASADPKLAEVGVVPSTIAQVMNESLKAKKTHSPIFEKNATPSPGSLPLETVFDAVQPKLVVPERDNHAQANIAETGQAALSRYGDLKIQTGSDFVAQWKPDYLSQAFPFAFRHVTGGPEFKEGERSRVEGAARVDIFDYASGIPRRIERHIRADWMLVPALRNLYFRRALLESSSIMYKMDTGNDLALQEEYLRSSNKKFEVNIKRVAA